MNIIQMYRWYKNHTKNLEKYNKEYWDSISTIFDKIMK